MTECPENILARIQDTKRRKLHQLDLGEEFLSFIPAEIFELEQLEVLNLRRNNLTSVPDAIAKLHDLKVLDLSRNDLTALPAAIAQLHNLIELNLGLNKFTTFPDAVIKLRNLTSLNLDYNQIRYISPEILKLRDLRELYLGHNPIETPPPEIIGLDALNRADIATINNYFRQLEAVGIDYLYEAKLLIIGEGGAGKTTLARKIQDRNYRLQDEDTTRGIDVIQWSFPMEKGRRFRVNIWDFGGQEIYHATHQFFLTKRSMYVLVADTRREDTDFYYWLNVVELLSDNSPTLIVKNEKQDRHREIPERQLRGQFTNLKEILPTNLATNRGLDQVLAEIKHHVSHLPHVGAPLPKTWVRVRQALEKDQRNYISLEEYLDICQRNGFTLLRDKLQLSEYLHDLGVCLHFQDDPLLRKTVILKPHWGTAAVYKVLDNARVIYNRGQFTRDDLANIWNDPQYVDMRDELLQLMIKFQLCYQIPGSPGIYIAPQLLTENQPQYKWDEASNLLLRYTYEFMPKGILSRFVVATHRYITDQRRVWKSGVVLEKDKTSAEVIEYYGRREIRIRIMGMYKRELMTIVTYELDKIHSSYKRLRLSKLIPCNCAVCKNSQEPHFYAFDVLRRFALDQKPIQCQKSYHMVDVKGLIDNVVGMFQNREQKTLPPEYLPQLRRILETRFDEGELRTLCFDIGVDYDSLRGEGKASKARELISHLERQGQLFDLIATIDQQIGSILQANR